MELEETSIEQGVERHLCFKAGIKKEFHSSKGKIQSCIKGIYKTGSVLIHWMVTNDTLKSGKLPVYNRENIYSMIITNDKNSMQFSHAFQ